MCAKNAHFMSPEVGRAALPTRLLPFILINTFHALLIFLPTSYCIDIYKVHH